MTDKSELLFLGAECHHSACHLHDFLPFNCPACSTTFCQDHFLPSHHDCQSPLPASMVDRLAPTCPMCNQVVPTHAAGPDQAVERHILGGTCVAMDGGEERRKAELKRKKERGEVCYRRGCTKVLIVPMACLVSFRVQRLGSELTCSRATINSARRTDLPKLTVVHPTLLLLAPCQALESLLLNRLHSPNQPCRDYSHRNNPSRPRPNLLQSNPPTHPNLPQFPLSQYRRR